MSVKYVVLYDTAPDGISKLKELFPAHFARGQEFHRRGELLMFGPFANPLEEGSMAIFSSRQAAEEFVAGDPFVIDGVVRNPRIREWNEALAP